MLEKQPLRPGQLDELAATANHPPLEVDLDVVEGDHAGAGLDAGRASDDRTNACRKLVGMEGLRDVVVGAQVEALGLVGGGALGGEENHGNRPLLSELPHDLDAVEVGHHDVEEDDVRANLLGLDQRVFASGRGHDPESLIAEGDRDQLRDEHHKGTAPLTLARGAVLKDQDVAVSQAYLIALSVIAVV